MWIWPVLPHKVTERDVPIALGTAKKTTPLAIFPVASRPEPSGWKKIWLLPLKLIGVVTEPKPSGSSGMPGSQSKATVVGSGSLLTLLTTVLTAMGTVVVIGWPST